MEMSLVKKSSEKANKRYINCLVQILLGFKASQEIYFLKLFELDYRLIKRIIITRIILDMRPNLLRRYLTVTLIGLNSN